jgi:outer membrane protein TolC
MAAHRASLLGFITAIFDQDDTTIIRNALPCAAREATIDSTHAPVRIAESKDGSMNAIFSPRRVLARAVVAVFFSAAFLAPVFAGDGDAPSRLTVAAPAVPTVRKLTLADAKQFALANNKALALARLNVAEKGHAANAARKDYFPKVLGIDDYFHFNDDLGSVVTIQRGARGILPPGVVTIDAAVLNQNSNLAAVMVAQPITKLIAVNAAVQVARADQAAAQAQMDKGARAVLSDVAQAYYGLLGAQRIQTALELQTSALEQLLSAQASPELRIGLVQVRQGLAQARGQVHELTNELDDLLDLPAETLLDLVDPVPLDEPVHSAEEAVSLALACSPEVREAEQGIAKAEAAMKMAKMAYAPDVSVVGGYANQTAASYIQPNIGFVGVTGSITFFEWGKKQDVKRQRELDIAMANQNVQVAMDSVRLNARKTFGGYEQAREEFRLAGDMVQARKEAEKGATGAAALQAKSETTKAELLYMKAEIAYRVAHAQLTALVCPQ